MMTRTSTPPISAVPSRLPPSSPPPPPPPTATQYRPPPSIHPEVKPFVKAGTNTFAELANYQIFFVYFVSLLLSYDPSFFSQSLGWLLVLFNMLIGIAILYIGGQV